MPWLASGYSVAQCALLTSCPSCPVVLCRWSRPGPAPAAAAPARSCAPPEGGQWSVVTDHWSQMSSSGFYHFIFRHSEAAALGAGNWLLGVVFALLEVVGERVQLDHHRAAVQLIVTPAPHTCHVSLVT